MPKSWSWFAGKRSGGRLWAVAAVCATLALPAAAATVQEKRVRHTVQGDGTILQEVSLRVLLEEDRDHDDWSPYPIWLDEHRSLKRIETYAIDPDGKRINVKARHHDEMSVAASYELYGSAKARLVEFPLLGAGSRLFIEYQVEESPYFPAGAIHLAEKAPVAELSVEVRGVSAGTGNWHWHLSGGGGGLEFQEVAGGLTLTATDVPPREDLARDNPEGRAPVLYYGWSEGRSWQEVASWYQDLLTPLARNEASVRSQARTLVAGITSPRERLEKLLSFLRQDVRYVAVEVGIGGYRPTPAAETLERRWGDCKDKSLLLIDLLQEAGIDAFPVLIHSSLRQDIDPEFPSPHQFNHLIVAVSEEGVQTTEEDPVAEGYLFLDPTQERGGAGWLAPQVQGKRALVVRGGASALITTPQRTAQESRRLSVRARVDGQGNARGQAVLAFSGRWAAAFRDVLQTPEAESVLRRTFQRFLPGSNLAEVKWGFDEASVPRLEMAAEVYLAGLVQDSGDRRSARLPGLVGTPEPKELEEPQFPLTVEPVSDQVRWELEVPRQWCLPESAETGQENDLGRFHQSVSLGEEGSSGNTFTLERRVEIHARKVSAEELPDLQELALAEHRAQRRRLRWACPP